MARIEDERAQREGLEKERVALVKRKQALVRGNAKRKEDLRGLDGMMEGFIDAAKPIEKVLGLVGGKEVVGKEMEKEKEKEGGEDDAPEKDVVMV